MSFLVNLFFISERSTYARDSTASIVLSRANPIISQAIPKLFQDLVFGKTGIV